VSFGFEKINERVQYMELRKRTISLAMLCWDIPWN
jgi:hypothetical protein